MRARRLSLQEAWRYLGRIHEAALAGAPERWYELEDFLSRLDPVINDLPRAPQREPVKRKPRQLARADGGRR